MLNKRAKRFSSSEPHLKTGGLVWMVKDNSPRGYYPLARVKSLNYGNDGRTRSAVIRSATGKYTRPIVKFPTILWGRSMLARLTVRLFHNEVNSYRIFWVRFQQNCYLKLKKPFNLSEKT